MKLPTSGADFIRMFGAGHWREKVIGAGLLGLLIAARAVSEMRDSASLTEKLMVLIALPSLIMVAGGVLARADTVRRRRCAGERVGPISRLFFGVGVWSFLIWIIVVLLIGFPLAVWIGSLASGVPTGK